MILKKWNVSGYKSIKSAALDLDNLTVVIGKNNSGKSNLLESLHIYADSISGPANYSNQLESFNNCVNSDKKLKEISFSGVFELNDEEINKVADKIDIDPRTSQWLSPENFGSRVKHSITFSNGWDLKESKFEVKIDSVWVTITKFSDNSGKSTDFSSLQGKKKRDVIRRGEVLNLKNMRMDRPIKTIHSGYKEIFKSSTNSWTSIGAFRNPSKTLNPEQSKDLKNNGENLVQVIRTIQGADPDRFDDAKNRFTSIMEGVNRIKTPYRNGSRVTVSLEEENIDRDFDLKDISSGTKEILTLIIGIINAEENSDLLTVEEPELHLHPEAEEEIFEMIKQATGKETQIFLATHSDVFVNRSDIGNIIRSEREKSTTFRSVSTDQIEQELLDLGYNQSGLLQSDAVAFVEGLSDRMILSTFATTLGYDLEESGVSIIELEGEGNMRTHGRSLVKTLYDFDIPYRFIVDSDGRDQYEVTKEYVNEINREQYDWHTTPENFLVWENYDIESYLIKRPVAIAEEVGMDVEVVKELIKDNSGLDKKSKVLDKIYARAYDQFEEGEAYQKDKDGAKLANRIEDVPDDIEDVISEICSLV